MVGEGESELEGARRLALHGALGESRWVREPSVVENVIDVESARLEVESIEVVADSVGPRLLFGEEAVEVGAPEVVSWDV